jgi:division protein CdvB (Snf7/Vps24/ESCRT-III family)
MRQNHEEARQARNQMVERAREWQRQIRAEHRQLERDINKIRQEEAKLKREITSMAAKGQTQSVQTLAKQVVSSRRSVARLEKTKCSLNALNLQLTTNIASASTASAMKLSANMMKEMNAVANVPQMQRTIEEMRGEMARAEVADEIMEEFYDQEDEETEVDEEVQKVYDELVLDKSQLLAQTAVPAPQYVAPAAPEYVPPHYAGSDPLLQRMQALRT